jgi:hypothetical protein
MFLTSVTVRRLSSPQQFPLYLTSLAFPALLGSNLMAKYEGYPESKFRWGIEKNYFQNHLYCHLMYIPYITFHHSFHHC